MKRIISFSIVVLALSILSTQLKGQVLDGAFARETTVKRNVVEMPFIREADAMYSKKVLRILELKEKQNLPLYYPQLRFTYPGELQPQRSRVNLLYLVYDIGIQGKTFVKATGAEAEPTESFDNRFPVYKLDAGDITTWWKEPIEKDNPVRDSLLSYEGTIKVIDPYSDPDNPEYIEEAQKMILEQSDRGVMDELWVWEEWFFDRQRSVMDVRIIAMSFDGYTSDGRVWPFWVPYTDYRPLFSTYESFNSHNEAEHRTFDDIFMQRRFSSFIVAETNNYDNRLISDYLVGIEAIREGERIQNQLFLMKHDMWEY